MLSPGRLARVFGALDAVPFDYFDAILGPDPLAGILRGVGVAPPAGVGVSVVLLPGILVVPVVPTPGRAS